MNDRVDELRQQLRALGYLDAGVDRFLLAPASGGRGLLAVAARSSLRVGLLGGALLGPSAAIGIGARLPGLIGGLRDAFVIAIYLAVFFFLAISVTSFIVTAIASAMVRGRNERFARQASRISRAAGWITSLVCLAYLTLWWRNANAGFGWSAPVWTAFALLVAVAISLLLGHAQRITTLAALAAAAGPSVLLPPVAARSWRVVLGFGALAFAGAAALLVSTAAIEHPASPDHPPLTVISNGRGLRVIAIDGFDPQMFDAFAGDLAASTVATRAMLQPQDTSDPARAWTTIATGVPPESHGVHGIETRRVAGLQGRLAAGNGATANTLRAATDLVRLTTPSVASRDERRAKTVWEVAEEAGLRTAVVNWWATWPAPASGGIVITDRAPLRLEQGGPLDAEIAPASLYDPLRAAWPSIRERARAAGSAIQAADPAIDAVLQRSAELDATILGLLEALPGPPRDLDVVYLPGLDIAQHALLASREGGATAPSAAAARVDAIRSYYGLLRRLLGPLLVPSAKTHVLLVLQPGRVEIASPGLFAAYQSVEGVFDARVGATRKGDLRVEDIAPTILNQLGVPLSRDLAGAPAALILPVVPPRYVDTYGRPFTTSAPRQGRPLDQEMIDRLRSLGYIK